MPSMLGLTTDPSPHGLNAPRPGQGQGQGRFDESSTQDKQLATRGSRAMAGGAPDSSESRSPQPQQQTQKQQNAPDDNKGKENTIKARNHAAAVEMEKILWQSLCDRPRSALKYMGKDAVMSNWPLFGDSDPREGDDLRESLENADIEFLSTRMGDPHVVEVGLMAVALVYPITLFQPSGKPDADGSIRVKTIEALVSSSWRQVASGDWEMTSTMVA
ncbi:hypothetical protein SODALDRAFT_327230 [Sodiomyces alkalinus F11]|uniref:DUF4440 domain-containing protein n=1 Tax=Sodiomyces alkalinus (strain CBS 110278 / VKM F-3762 / F11) TaxID=1314773 RepID=A0A3N2Q8W5_SODAK|nr:hypothetical protein SODALDRAFT_327230 [Sodiomyces alkalinus F11]ROT43065.1 hypothetical protein SODALDRAFT_327230 [Sodiomyces alkalinus F11]